MKVLGTFLFVLVHLLQGTFSHTIDKDCFDSFFQPATNHSRHFPNDVLVTVKHLHTKQQNFGSVMTTLKSTKSIILTRDEQTFMVYNYPHLSNFKDYNPRHLTLLFNGEKVQAAIGHLKERYSSLSGSQQEWLDCEAKESDSFMTLTFHEYSSLLARVRTSSTREKLEIHVAPPNTPYGPSYDNDCSSIMGASAVSSKASLNVHIKHLSRLWTASGTFYKLLSERNTTVVGGSSTVVHFNHTTAVNGYGFTGANANPRNMTLWVKEDGNLGVAIARLSQQHSFIVDHQENDEKWECPELEEDKIVFCSFSTYTTGKKFSFTSESDVLQVNFS